MNFLEESVLTVTDDFTKIEGINSTVADLLNASGILTYLDLSATPAVKIKEIMSNAGPRFNFRDVTTWSKQASLAASGQWNRLQTWQEELQQGSVRMPVAADEEE